MAVKKSDKKPTEYVVLRSGLPTGPYDIVGSQTAHGQVAAKRAAALQDSAQGNDPEKSFYVAVPASSFAPQKPVVQMTITFSTEGVVDEEEEDEETEEETEPDPEPETQPADDGPQDVDEVTAIFGDQDDEDR